MLSLTCKAAIKAVIYLGSKPNSGEKSSIKQVAEFINENEHTVGKLLQKLVKENIINSTKGPNGGFFITEQQKKAMMIDIVEAIDGKDMFNKCGLGLSKCSAMHPCPIHDDYKKVRDTFKQICDEKRIVDLCSTVNENLAYLVG